MELQQFGWNTVTVSFLGTILFTFIMAWGLWQQNKAIWRQRSGRSVNVLSFFYSAAFATTVFTYGLTTGRIALSVNGLVMLTMVTPILIGLWKFKGFSRWEKFLAATLFAGVCIMIASPAKDWFFLVTAFGGIIFRALLPLEMWRNKDAGVVEIRLLVVGLLSVLFWLMYAFAIDDWVLKVINPCYLAISIASIFLWFRFRKLPEKMSV